MIGHLIDLALLVLLLEAVFTRRAAAAAGQLRAWLGTLGAGAALLLAMRLITLGAAWPWVAACLTLALAGHLVDLVSRLSVGRRRDHAAGLTRQPGPMAVRRTAGR